LEKQKKLKVKS